MALDSIPGLVLMNAAELSLAIRHKLVSCYGRVPIEAADAFNSGMTMAGCPAINVPAGFSATGLPMGIQIMAPNHAERACLEIGYAYDVATRWVERRMPPMLVSATA